MSRHEEFKERENARSSEYKTKGEEMKTETYLQSARDLKFKIDQLQEERDEILRSMTAIKSTSDYGERVQTSPTSTDIADSLATIAYSLKEINTRQALKAI